MSTVGPIYYSSCKRKKTLYVAVQNKNIFDRQFHTRGGQPVRTISRQTFNSYDEMHYICEQAIYRLHTKRGHDAQQNTSGGLCDIVLSVRLGAPDTCCSFSLASCISSLMVRREVHLPFGHTRLAVEAVRQAAAVRPAKLGAEVTH